MLLCVKILNLLSLVQIDSGWRLQYSSLKAGLDNCDEGTGPQGQSSAVALPSSHCTEEQRRRQENGESPESLDSWMFQWLTCCFMRIKQFEELVMVWSHVHPQDFYLNLIRIKKNQRWIEDRGNELLNLSPPGLWSKFSLACVGLLAIILDTVLVGCVK